MAGDKRERRDALDADALNRHGRHTPAVSDDASTRYGDVIAPGTARTIGHGAGADAACLHRRCHCRPHDNLRDQAEAEGQDHEERTNTYATRTDHRPR